MTAVLVSHPHVAAVSAGLAESLAEAGRLAGYFTGVAFAPASLSGRLAGLLAARRPVLRNRILANIPPRLLHAQVVVELSARIAARALAGVHSRLQPYNAVFAAHDLAVARRAVARRHDDDLRLRGRRSAHVPACGTTRVWIASGTCRLPHYRTIGDHLPRRSPRAGPTPSLGPPHREPEWKQHRKDAELALATKISVASRFTKRSLEGIASVAPVVVGPYGFPVAEFAAASRAPDGRSRVLSVGAHDLRKGTPYLLEAWRRAALPDAELHLIGPLRLAKSFVDGYAGSVRTLAARAPSASSRARYAAADLLAFPTLGDGFGLVIQEAMCCATPVVTTPCGGGPECITDGVDGWLVPPRDIDALVARLRACAADRDATARVGRAARARAERWTWRQATESMVRAPRTLRSTCASSTSTRSRRK